MTPIGPPPDTVAINGKEYYLAIDMVPHLHRLRERISRLEFAVADTERRLKEVTKSFADWRQHATRPK